MPCIARANVSIALNATTVTVRSVPVDHDAVVEVDAAAGNTSTPMPGNTSIPVVTIIEVVSVDTATGNASTPVVAIVRMDAIASALGVNVSSVTDLTVSPDHQSLTFTVVPPPAVNSSNGLSDGDMAGRLVMTMGPWASQVTVQRAAGTRLMLGSASRPCIVN